MHSSPLPVDPEHLKPLSQGTNAFGLKLLQSIPWETGNCSFSPISISCAMGMLYLGSSGRTARQLAEVFGFSHNPEEVEMRFRQFLDHVKSMCHEEPPLDDDSDTVVITEPQGDLVFNISNALWGQKEYPFRREYTDRLKRSFEAHVENLQFLPTPEVAIELVNEWVIRHTRGRIQEILDENLPWGFVRLILTNAVYFKASWELPFYETKTEAAPFHLAQGAVTEVAFMNQEETFGYYHSVVKDFQALEMKYAGGRLSMLVFLPGKADGLPALEQWLTAERLDLLSGKIRLQDVRVALPKFLIETQCPLSESLKAMGVGDVFDQGKADIPGIAETEPVWVTEVLHKVWMDVNEQGTEAAAVTAVMVAAGIEDYKPLQAVEFRADRPFLYFIRDRATGCVLFCGRVVKP